MNDLFSMKFRLFRVSGIQVYLHILFLFFAGLELWEYRATPGFGLLVVFVLWGCVLLHEFGHCAGARYQGGDATEVLLWPLGGLAMCDAPQTPWAQGFVAASGPAVNVVLFALGWGLTYAVPGYDQRWDNVVGFSPVDVAHVLMYTNGTLFAFNMLPAFPMDMGRIYQALLWVWMGFVRSMRIACYTTFVCAAGFLVWVVIAEVAPPTSSVSAVLGPGLMLMFVLWITQEAWNQLQLVNSGYFDDQDEPWRQTFRHDAQQEDKPREPGLIARWQAKREEQRVKQEAEQQQERAARLDEVLRRVAQVGMDGLTVDEKAFLDQESARLREKR